MHNECENNVDKVVDFLSHNKKESRVLVKALAKALVIVAWGVAIALSFGALYGIQTYFKCNGISTENSSNI